MVDSKEKEFEIISSILNGHRDLYRKLVDQYAPMVFTIVNKFVDREDDREELAQQIFVKAYERLDSFSMKSKFSSWLYRLAQNHCLDYAKNIRRSNKKFNEMKTEELDSKLNAEEQPDQEIESQEQKVMLEQALATITPTYAEAFLMKYRDNMSYKAMAERLDAKEGTLKVRVHRARKELKGYMKDYNIKI